MHLHDKQNIGKVNNNCLTPCCRNKSGQFSKSMPVLTAISVEIFAIEKESTINF